MTLNLERLIHEPLKKRTVARPANRFDYDQSRRTALNSPDLGVNDDTEAETPQHQSWRLLLSETATVMAGGLGVDASPALRSRGVPTRMAGVLPGAVNL